MQRNSVCLLMSSLGWFNLAVFANRSENRLRGFPSTLMHELNFSLLLIWIALSSFVSQHHERALSHTSVESQRGLISCPLQQSSCSVMAAMFLKASAEKWTCCLILLFLCAIVRSGWLRSLFSQTEEHVYVFVSRAYSAGQPSSLHLKCNESLPLKRSPRSDCHAAVQ